MQARIVLGVPASIAVVRILVSGATAGHDEGTPGNERCLGSHQQQQQEEEEEQCVGSGVSLSAERKSRPRTAVGLSPRYTITGKGSCKGRRLLL